MHFSNTSVNLETTLIVPSPYKRPRQFDYRYRFFGIELYKKDPLKYKIPDPTRTQKFRMATQSLTGEANLVYSKNRPIEKTNMLVSMLQNIDASVDIYTDAMDFFIYITVYRFKWTMIYFVMFNSVYLLIFTFLFIREVVVKPINELVDVIMKPDDDGKMANAFKEKV